MKPQKPNLPLTPQEKRMLVLAGQGFGRNRIAQELEVSPGNVKRLVNQVKRKLELKPGADTTAMVAEARKRRLIP